MRQGRKRSRERGDRSCSRRKHSRKFSDSGSDRRRRHERGRSYERDRSRRRRSRNGRNSRDSRDRRYRGGGGGGGGRTTRSNSQQSFHSSGSSSIDDEVGHFHGRPGSVLRDRYVVQEELGKGTFGKVFKCHDKKHNDVVAVKVVRSIERYIESAVIEADLLNDIYERQKEQRKNCCVKMFSRFRMDDHYCIVFETLGKSLFDVIKANDYKRLPMPMVRDISRQLIEAMHFLKSVNLIHTDLKLENVLFVHTTMQSCEVTQGGKTYTVSVPEKSRIKLIDFGGATYDNDPRKSRVINTRQYRGPEVILELGWSFPSDLWSVGCIIGEIYRGDLFFQTHDELEHLVLMEKLRGLFPMSMIQASEFRSKYFDRDGRVRYADLSRDSKSFVRDAMTLEEFFALEEADTSTGIIQLVEGLLQLDPNRRLTAEEALQMPFLQQSTVETSEGSTTAITGSSI